jgi:threonine synthase
VTAPALECPRCGRRESDPRFGFGCPTCEAEGVAVNLTTSSDREATIALLAPGRLDGRPFTQLRYAEALGLDESGYVGLGEGGTPLLEAPELARRVGVRRLWIKDEARNPTWSFKDRAASLAAFHARRLGCRGLVVASTGNAAAATVAYARRAGLVGLVLFAKDPPVHPVMEAYVRAYGGLVVAAPTKPDRWSLMRYAVEELGFFPNSNFSNPPLGNTPWAVDGYRALGLEIWEQLGRRAPGSIVFPIGHGDAVHGVFKAFSDLAELGLSAIPVLGGGEIYGSLSRAFAENSETPPPVPVDRDTVASSIAVSQSTYQALHALRGSGGWIEQIADDEALEAQRLLVECEGMFVETTSAVALAALMRRLGARAVDREDDVVLVSTSSGMKSAGAIPMAGEIPLLTDNEELAALLPP